MTQSAIQICNMALAHIGAKTISDLKEGSAESIQANLFYDLAIDATLADFSWNFASKRHVMAQKTENLSTFAYCYGLPFDCLVVREISRRNELDDPIPFSVGNQDGERVIYTDHSSATVVYTARVTDPSLFSPGFVLAASFRLAMFIVMPITQNLSVANRVAQNYQMALVDAQSVAAQEGTTDKRREADWIARRTGQTIRGIGASVRW